MSVVENIRTDNRNSLSSELKVLKQLMDDRFDQIERNAEIRHQQIMNTLQHLALSMRVARLESRESAH